MESTINQKLLLENSKLPSIGSFITILSFIGLKAKVAALLNSLKKGGPHFYKEHVETSSLIGSKFYLELDPENAYGLRVPFIGRNR
jgi:hypothetical protein